MEAVASVALLVVVALVTGGAAHGPYRQDAAVDTRTSVGDGVKKVVQPVDHFNASDNRTWSQNYGVRDELHRRGGPVFLSVGGEWPVYSGLLDNGDAWQQYAREHGALMFQLEHRYYGMSRPTSDMSTERLMYLTLEQAVADLASFIRLMTREHQLPPDTRWVVFGCSVSASLAAYLRADHPDLVHAVVASSPTLNVKLAFPEYLEGVRNSLRTYGQDCVDAVQRAFTELDQLMTSPRASFLVDQTVWICGKMDPDNEKDVTTLNDKLANDLMYVVQYSEHQEYGGTTTMQDFCDDMTDQSRNKTYLQRFVDTIRIYATAHGCISANYTRKVEGLRRREWGSSSYIERQHLYQLCTQLGYFQTSESKDAYLGSRLPLNYYLELCKDVFGDKYTEDYVQRSVAVTHEKLSDVSRRATRVLHVHGSLDPWSTLTPREALVPESPLIMIPGATHCEDTRPALDSDSPALRDARKNISRIIGQWLAQ